MKSEKKLEIVEKKIYICPNNSTQNRNVRIDDNGQEIILNDVLSPWIIVNVFKIKQTTKSSKNAQADEERKTLLQIRNDINQLHREISVLISPKYKKSEK